MKTFKLVDLRIQVFLLVGSVIMMLLFRTAEAIFLAPLIVGGWQVVSMLVHLFTRNIQKKSARLYYSFTTLGIIMVSLCFWIWPIEPSFIFAAILLFLSPFLALTYLSICYQEYETLHTQETSTL